MVSTAASRIPSRSIPRGRRLRALFTAAAALTLAGCGGGSGNNAPPTGGNPNPPPPPPAVTITGIVADGPLQGATACYDLNDNAACDAGEPTSTLTDAAGAYAISVAPGDAGAHAVIVDVPATAIDSTTGAPIGTALTFRAPATGSGAPQSVFVSPLTTMVAGQMRATGMSAADAAAYVQAQAGLAISPLADFTGNAPAQQQAALLARLAVQTQIALLNTLALQLGTTAANGTTVTASDIAAAAADALRGALPALAATAASSTISGAADVQAALVAAAQELVRTQPALEPTQALAVVEAAKLSNGVTLLNTPAATLRALRFTDASNWTMRYMAANAADNTPDAQGLVRFYDVHRASTAGAIQTWGYHTLPARAGDLHWNGSQWIDCPLGTRSTQTQRDAAGRSQYDYCNGFERGSSTRTELDIGGQTMASVITNLIRPTPGEDSGVAYADWGPADLGLLGNATFPSGARLFYQTSIPTFNAFAHDVNAPATTFGTAAAAGGNVPLLPPGTPSSTLACHQAFVGVLSASNVGTLEQLAANNPGTPCIENQQSDAAGSSLTPNVWWGATSVSLGNVSDAATPPSPFYAATANLRVAFVPNSTQVKYLSCYVRTTTGGAARNCSEIGGGSYVIEPQLANGQVVSRVMSFSNLPAVAQRLNFNRIFVERGGTVYAGYRGVDNVARATVRLNLDAANALLGTLGIAAIAP